MKELVLRVNSKVSLKEDDATKIINGVTNQSSGLMALKSVCQKENLNTNSVFDWCRVRGWINQSNEVPRVKAKALIDWGNLDVFTNVLTLYYDEVLLVVVNNTYFVDTNCIHYTKFIETLQKANLVIGYNKDVKEYKFKLSKRLKEEIKELNIKVRLKDRRAEDE